MDSHSDEQTKAEDGEGEEKDGNIPKEFVRFNNDSIDEKSKRIKRTEMNIMTIIHQLLKDKKFRDMFINMMERGELREQLREAIFEPKLTRSKLKKVMKSGQVPLPWSINSSLKNKTLMDLDFEEEDDDEEYTPSKDELNHLSDDEESISSSRASECGSPFISRSALSSPEVRRIHPNMAGQRDSLSSPTSSKIKTPDKDRKSMGPPKSNLPIKKMILQNEELQKGHHASSEEELNSIALRTRSKLPLKDTSLNELESQIVDPDVWQDIQDMDCSPTSPDNECWQQFLACLADDDLRAFYGDDEDTNDPEFNFIREEDMQVIDREEVRCDKGVQIPKKEVECLMDEFLGEMWEYNSVEDFPQFSLLGDEEFDNQTGDSGQTEEPIPDEEGHRGGYPIHIPKLSTGSDNLAFLAIHMTKDGQDIMSSATEGGGSTNQDGALKMTEEEKIQLRVQMMQHVQLLAQTYVCSSHNLSTPEFKRWAETSKHLLEELQSFNVRFSSVYRESFFNIPNLKDALDTTTTTYEDDATCDSSTSILDLNYKQMDKIVKSCAFPYPALLPRSKLAFSDGSKTVFCRSEDNLLAMGLSQFDHLPNKLQFKFMRELILPVRTETQLMTRFRNLKRRGVLKYENPVQYLLKNKKLPRFERSLDLLQEKDMLPPGKREPSLLPNWFHRYELLRNAKEPKQEPAMKRVAVRRNVSTVIAERDAAIQRNTPQTAPVIIVQVQPSNANLYVPYNSPIIISELPRIKESVKILSNRTIMIAKAPVPIIPTVQVLPSPTLSLSQVPNVVTVMPAPQVSGYVQSPTPFETMTSTIRCQGSSSDAQSLMVVSSPVVQSSAVFPQPASGPGETLISREMASRVVTFAKTPEKQNPESSMTCQQQSEEDLEVDRNNEFPVMTPRGETAEVKVLESSREPCITFSHDQLKALGVKINEMNTSILNLQPPSSSDHHNDACSGAVTGQPKTSVAVDASSNDVSLSKWFNFSLSSDFLKTFGNSLSSSANVEDDNSTTSEAGDSRHLHNKTLSVHFSGDLSLNSSDAMGFHNLEEFFSSRELSRIISRTMESEDSLLRLGDSQMGDLFGISPFKIEGSVPIADPGATSVGTTTSLASNCVKNLFADAEQGVKSKTISVANALEYFSSDKFASSTPLAKEVPHVTSIPKINIGFSNDIETKDRDRIEGSGKVSFSMNKEDHMAAREDLPEIPVATIAVLDQKSTREVNKGNSTHKGVQTSDQIVDNLKIVLTADLENLDPILGVDGGHLVGLDPSDQNRTLYTPKKFSVNEYDNIKKLSSPVFSAGMITPKSPEDHISPNSKRQSLRTIAHLEKLCSPPLTVIPNRSCHPVTPLSAKQDSPNWNKMSINSSPFKKRFANFKPKQLNFSSLDGANDQKNDNKSKTSDNSRPRLRSVAPKPPFIQITGDLVKNKKPLGRRKQTVPRTKHIPPIRPKQSPLFDASLPPVDSHPKQATAEPNLLPVPEEEAVDEDVLIAELMNASTTIDLDKKATAQLLEKQRTQRLKEKQDLMLSLLDEKLLESDPLRSRRDMLYAESYVSRVRERFKNRPDLFSKFNEVLFRFANTFSESIPEKDVMEEHKKLYGDLRVLFKDHPDLLSDYAGFLSLDQAVHLDCFISSLEFEKARIFMTKLEKYFKKRPQTFHRCLKVMKECRDGAISEEEMKSFVKKQIKNNSHLLDEFSWFFPDSRPQLSQKQLNFEEVDLSLVGETNSKPQFERVELPVENQESFGTSSCGCSCHLGGTEVPIKKSRHCPACITKVQSSSSKHPSNASNLQSARGKCHPQNEDKSQRHLAQECSKCTAEAAKDVLCVDDDKSSLVTGLTSPLAARSQHLKTKSRSSPLRNTKPSKKEKPSNIVQGTQPKVCFLPTVDTASIESQGESKQSTRKKSNLSHAPPLKSGTDDTTAEEGKNQKNLRSSKRKVPDRCPKADPNTSKTVKTCEGNDASMNQRKRKRRCITSSESEGESDCRVSRKRAKRNEVLSARGEGCTESQPEKVHVEGDNPLNADDVGLPVVKAVTDLSGQSVQSLPVVSCKTEAQWSRDEDKILLEACQVSGSDASTFEVVASTLGNKSAEEVKMRFEYLMELYSKMDSGSDIEQ